MYYGRKKGIIIGAVIAVVVILLTIISIVVVLKTDLFKSSKTLFWKYTSIQLESFEQTPNMQLQEIEKLKLQSPYILQGELTLDEDSEDTSTLPNIKLIVNAENDKTNEYSHIKSKIEYENNTMFDLDYVKNDNIYALKSDEIINGYLGIKNENLKVLFQKLGVQDTSSIPDEIAINNYSEIFKFSKEELEHIKETYKNVIENAITSESYSRQTGAILEKNGTSYKTTSYRLDLTSDQIVSIVQNILNTLKTDSITLNLIVEKAKLLGMTDEEITIEDLTTAIDEAISEISQEQFQDISFVVYNYKGKTIQAEVIAKNVSKTTICTQKGNTKIAYENYEEGNNITIEITSNLTTTQSNIETKIDIDNETQVNISIMNNGSASQKSLNTTCEIAVVNGENEVKATYNQTIEFVDELEETVTLDETNCVILNDYSKEDVTGLLEAIEERIVQVMNEKIQSIVAYSVMNNMQNNVTNNQNNNSTNSISDQIRNIGQGNNIYNTADAFNQKFKQYIGENVVGLDVKALLGAIRMNNAENSTNKIKIIYANNMTEATTQEQIQAVENQIENTQIYKVEAKYSETTKLIEEIKIAE